MLDDFKAQKKCGVREKEKLRRNKAEPRRKIRSTRSRTEADGAVRRIGEDLAIRFCCLHVVVHGNSLKSIRENEKRVFFLHFSVFSAAIFTCFDGVRFGLFVPSSSYDFFHISLFSCGLLPTKRTQNERNESKERIERLIKVLTRYFHP